MRRPITCCETIQTISVPRCASPAVRQSQPCTQHKQPSLFLDTGYRIHSQRCCCIGTGSPAVSCKTQLTPASTGGRGLGKTAETCTPSKPPLPGYGEAKMMICLSTMITTCLPSLYGMNSCVGSLALAGLHAAASARPVKEVLGSRKSVRRSKLPLPAQYDILLQLFGTCWHLTPSLICHRTLYLLGTT